jgi:hypothetical protein
MSIRKVLSVILAKFEVCPSRATIARYAKLGLVNASPMKMGPAGLLPAMAYKFLCQAYLSLIPINQMNACAGDNSRKEMIPMLTKTFNIGTIEATGLLNHVVCDLASGRLPHLLDDVPTLGSLVRQLGGVLGRLL